MRTVSSGIDLMNNIIIGLADPTDAQNAATKAYVDSQVSGGDGNSVWGRGCRGCPFGAQTSETYGSGNMKVQRCLNIPNGRSYVWNRENQPVCAVRGDDFDNRLVNYGFAPKNLAPHEVISTLWFGTYP